VSVTYVHSRFLWRIAKDTAQYTADDLSGAGAAAFGGRWNTKGRFVVYTSPVISLAVLESLAHSGDDISARNRFLVKITVPISVWNKRSVVRPENLPVTWVSEPPGTATINYGDIWLANNASALLEVPSVVIHEEYNVLINPSHPDAKKIISATVRQFIFDPRLK
jgi:RES domain-containing protein